MFKRFWWVLLVLPPLGAIAGLLTAGVITYVMPKKYESSATIEVRPRLSAGEPTVEGGSAPGAYAQMMVTEMEIMKSQSVLGEVVESLELTNRWAVDKQTAIGFLKGIVEIQSIRGTDLVSVRVRHTNAGDAKEIVRAVVDTYRQKRMSDEEIRAKLPLDAVLIHEAPTEPIAPVSPKVVLNLILGAGAGLLLGMPVALLLMWLLSRWMPEKHAG